MRISRIGVGILSAATIGTGALIAGAPPMASLVREASAAGERYTVADAWPGVTFETPVAVAAPRDGSDRVFVVERAGRIKVGKKFRGAGAVPAPTVFLDITRLQMPTDQLEQGHGGLVNLAFANDFATSKEFYVMYGTGTGQPADPYRTVIAAYKVGPNPDMADPASGRIVLQIPKKNPIHFGGGLCMGADGTLYVGVGDSGMHNDPERLGQDTRTLEAKILRIDPKAGPAGQPYGIPRDNPWADGRGGVKPEIFAYGVRNPYRLSVDRETGLVWFGDLGQKQREEVSVAKRGGNMGWPMMEADVPLAPGAKPAEYVAPVFAYGRELGRCVIGGLVYRGQRCSALRGKYLFGDNSSEWKTDDSKTGRVWALPVAGDRTTGAPEVVADVEDIVSIDEDAQGEVYFSMLATGRVTTLVPAP